jgi:diaminopimelate epimerase
MSLRFTKMQGLGNDFVVLDGVRQRLELDAESIRRLADRRFGVGCDQVLLVEAPRDPANDFRYRIFNADGGEVEQCGNGARCFVRFVREHGLTEKTEIRVETAGGLIVPRLESSGLITVDMGVPRFAPRDIPFIADVEAERYPLALRESQIEISAVSMGNPHAVQFVANLDAAPVAAQGAEIERHPRFPQRVNAGFVQVVDAHRIRLRVFERGVGETLACGTGACAAVVAGIRLGRLASPVEVETRGGFLSVAWAGVGERVFMTGPAQTVFEGEWNPGD